MAKLQIEKPDTIDEMVELFTSRLDQLKEEHEAMKTQAAEMVELGMTDAKKHWPSDKPGALVLLYSTSSKFYEETGRRKEYIGKKPERIAEAEARLKRYVDHKELTKKIRAYDYHIGRMESAIDNLFKLIVHDPEESWW